MSGALLLTGHERLILAKNRYGWNKRIKEIARKMKQEDKLKRRQSKSREKQAEETPEDTDTESGSAAANEDSPVV
jgi:Sec-independent protein translocase protein TatA